MPGRKHPIHVLILATLILTLACSFGRSSPTPTQMIEATAAQPPTQHAATSAPQGTAESASPQPPADTPPAALPAPNLRVVYTKEGNLWLWAAGEKRQITTSGEAYWPRISDDGQIIAFLRPKDSFHIELWAVNADGSHERRLVSVADLDTIGGGVRDPNAVAVNPYHFEWLPGAHTLAFNTHQIFQGPGLAPLNDLNLVNADSGEITYLFLSGWGGEFAYSPDGKQVAISTPTTIILANADGTNYRTVLNYEPVITYSEYRYYANPRWSQDSAFLRVAIPPADPLARPQQPISLWTIPTDGSQPAQDGSIMAVPDFEQPVRYSPDLARLAFLQEVGQPVENQRELHIATYDGQGDWVYSKAPLLRFEGWGLDGNHFAFLIGEEGQMWLGSLEAIAEPISDAPYGISNIRWLDGERFLYVQEAAGIFDFYLGSLEGQAQLLDSVPAPPPDFDFAWGR